MYDFMLNVWNLKRGRVKDEFQLFLYLSKSFPARTAVKLSTRCVLTEVKVHLCKLRRDNIVLIIAKVKVKHRSRVRSGQAE
jgi:hypothetical protein